MINKINSTLRRDEGFSLIELLIVVAIIGIIAAIAVPQLMNAMDRGRQRRSMADIRNIATANGTMRVDTGAYAGALANLAPLYMQIAPTNDGWGTAFVYQNDTPVAGSYTITSLGSDAGAGPAPPATWINDPYEPDIIMIDGMFTQAPTGQ
jgi:prepilin-type N-terminal cleavage/methylation domain-containing protein